MKFQTLILFTAIIFLSCSHNKKENLKKEYIHHTTKNILESIDNWSLIEYKEGIIDTSEVDILTSPAVFAKLKNKSQENCLNPVLEFYPIKLKEYVSKKLNMHLLLRSTLFPAPPRRYTTNKYYILIWNFEDYFTEKCCHCKSLEKKLKYKLKMKPTFTDSLRNKIIN